MSIQVLSGAIAMLQNAVSKISGANRLWVALLLMVCGAQLAQAERTTTFFHNDGAGSVVAASDQSGALLWRKEYAPFGEQLDSTAENEKIAYTGKEHDDVTGLTYFGARYYDPHLGRFTSVDPVGFIESNPMSFNRYAYGNNNPYKYVDPDGRLPILIPIVIFIAKEIAAEAASQATGGATDFLSVRRMGTKGVKYAAKQLAKSADASDVVSAGGRTNSQLVQEVATRAEAWGTRKGLPAAGGGHVQGTRKHKYADDLLTRYQRRYGDRGLETEVSYKGGVEVDYGTKGSVRLDVLEPSSGKVYDYKFTNSPSISPGRDRRIRSNVKGVGSITAVGP